MDTVTRNQVAQKSEIYLEETYKPLTLNVKKAMDVVNKFEMVWPDKDGNDPRGVGTIANQKQITGKQFQNMQVGDPAEQITAGERLGLYKKPQPSAITG